MNNITLYAQWKEANCTYNVNYVSSSGVSLGSTTVSGTYGSSKSVSAPAKTGYTTPTTQTVKFDSTTAKTITFTYTPVNYTITYNLNGGSLSGQKTSYTIESADITLPSPSKAGNTFAGWMGSNGTTAQTSVTITKGSTGNKTYTANWTVNKYYLDLNGVLDGKSTDNIAGYGTADVYVNDVKVATGVTDYYTQQPYGSTYKIVVTPTEGHSVVGNTTLTGTITGTTGVSPSLKTNSYTVTYKYNVSGNTTADLTQTATYGTAWTTKASNAFARKGYTLSSWNTQADGKGTTYAVNAQQTNKQLSNVTLYAVWKANTYALKFHPNGGIINVTDANITKNSDGTATVYVTYGATNFYNLGISASKTGYTMSGFYTATSGGTKLWNNGGACLKDGTYWNSSNQWTYDGAVDIYPQFTINNYTVTINPNGGKYNNTTANSSKSGSYQSKIEIAEIPTRNGYTFVGWKRSGGGTLHSGVAKSKSSQITMTEKADTDGTAYTNYKMNYQNTGTGIAYPSMNFFTYSYTQGHTYRLDFDVRVNSVSGLGYSTMRNSAFGNNWEAPSVSINAKTSGWQHKTVSRTLTGTTITQSSTEHTIAPIVEWYCSVPAGNTGVFDFDLKNISIYDVTAGTYVASTSADVKNSSYVTMTDSNSTLTAVWSLNTYSITYNVNGGNALSGQRTSYNVTSTEYTLPTPTRTGYTFTGWTGSNGSAPQTTVKIPVGSTGNKSYTANWSVNKYTYNIKYLSKSGVSLGTATIAGNYGSSATATPPAKTGYTAPANQTVSFDSTTAKTITFTYTPIAYTISYDVNGGDALSGQRTSYNIENDAYTLPTPTKKGYTFTGWTGSNGTTAQKTVTLAKGSTGNKSYTANWKVNSYTITYKANGGTGADQTQTVTYGTAWTSKGITFTKTGYTQTSWNTNADGTGTTYSLNKQQTDKQLSNVTLYAQYTPHTLTINYHNDGAEYIYWDNVNVNVKGQDITKSSIEKYGSAFTNGEAGLYDSFRWHKTGYTTKSHVWKNGKNGTTEYVDNKAFSKTEDCANYLGVLDSLKKGNVTVDLYPIWVANTYTIKYNGNGNTGGSTVNSSHTYDTAKTLTANGFTKTGYTFTGWNTQADGKGTAYADKASVKNLSSTNGTTITLYAQWKVNTLTVIYFPNGATKADNSSNMDGSNVITIDPNASNLTDTFKYDQALPSYGLWDSQRYIRTGYSSKNKYRVGSKDGTTLLDAGPNVYAKTQDLAKAAGKLTDLEKGDVTINIYADWTPIGYTITYNLDGGSISGQKTSYNIETATFTLPTPSKTGYTFAGWTGSNGTTAQTSVSIAKGSTGNKTYTAKWTAKTYTVTYNANGGTGAMSNDTVTFNTAFKTKQNTFKREGFIFDGWNEKADGSGTKWNITSGSSGTYESGKAWTWAYASNITLYAQWIPESYNWTVPTAIDFDVSSTAKSGTISVTDNTLAAGRTLKIKVADDASFKLKDKANSDNTCDYTVKKGSETLKAGSTVLSLPTDTKNANQAISININKSQIAGTYEDVLKFTASVE